MTPILGEEVEIRTASYFTDAALLHLAGGGGRPEPWWTTGGYSCSDIASAAAVGCVVDHEQHTSDLLGVVGIVGCVPQRTIELDQRGVDTTRFEMVASLLRMPGGARVSIETAHEQPAGQPDPSYVADHSPRHHRLPDPVSRLGLLEPSEFGDGGIGLGERIGSDGLAQDLDCPARLPLLRECEPQVVLQRGGLSRFGDGS